MGVALRMQLLFLEHASCIYIYIYIYRHVVDIGGHILFVV